MKLLLNALTKFILGLIMIGALLFLPAWTFHYPGAWCFIALLFLPMLIMGAVLFIKAPALLEKRLQNKTGNATFRTDLIDAVFNLTDQELKERIRYEVYTG